MDLANLFLIKIIIRLMVYIPYIIIPMMVYSLYNLDSEKRTVDIR